MHALIQRRSIDGWDFWYGILVCLKIDTMKHFLMAVCSGVLLY